MAQQIFPEFSSTEQTVRLNVILHKMGVIGKSETGFTVQEILNILPSEITYNGKRGDLTITHADISYISLNSDFKVNLIHVVHLIPNKNFFDGAIEMLEFLYNEKDNVKIP